MRTTVVLTATLLVAVAAPARAADPFGIDRCSGVRPGALIQSPRPKPPTISTGGPATDLYTMGFVFKDNFGVRYVSTVGNYIIPNAGKKVWKVGTGPKTKTGAGKAFGRFVYAVHIETTTQFDTFALVRLTPGFKYSPQVCHFGGPRGVYTATGTRPVALAYYGQGDPVDGTVHARTGVAFGTANKNQVLGAGPPGSGDEGAPVLIAGKALGILTGATGYDLTGVQRGLPPQGGNLHVTRLPKWIAAAQKALKVKLYLLTAKGL